MDTTDQTLSSSQAIGATGKMWRPIRPIAVVSTNGDQIQRLQKQVADLQTQVASDTAVVAPTPNAPNQVTAVSVSITPKTVAGSLKSLVAVSFSPGTNFALAQVWFTGYNGTETPQLMAQGSASPVQFIAETTGEAVTVTVVAVNSASVAAPFASAPSVIAVLSSTGTPPPAPSITSPTVALPGAAGWEFSWNVLSGLLNDVINGYWVYRSAVNTTPAPPASRLQFIAQPVSNLGTLTSQDYVAGTYYYWVSAVSVSGQESALTPAAATILSVRQYPSATTGTFSTPLQAFDGNESTSSSAAFSTTTAPADHVSAFEVWSGFANVTGTIVSATLEVLSYARVTRNASASLAYSLDGGSTFTTMYSISVGDGASAASNPTQYATAALLTSQDLTQVHVRALCSADAWYTGPVVNQWLSATAAQAVYECRITVTYS